MGKKYEDEEFDQFINAQFIREAEIMKEALFSGDEDTEEYEVSEEEMKASYQKLMQRLNEERVFPGDIHHRNRHTGNIRLEIEPEAGTVSERTVIPMKNKSCFRHKAIKAAGIVAVVGMYVFGAGMTCESDMDEAAMHMEYLKENEKCMVYEYNADQDSFLSEKD